MGCFRSYPLEMVFLNAGKRAVLEDFAIPFGDDDKDASIWFMDHN